jgi:dTDP-4-amino-4,6-dideoxygalactose transaminase
MGRSPAQLVADWLRGGDAPEFPQWVDRSVVFTQSGRTAILLAARLWGIGENDEVLVPSYNCGSEISPLIATGARALMYRVDGDASIDLRDLLRRITPRTRIVQVTHYFGYPEEIGELAEICRERNIKLLEDCALSLFSDALGRTGDAAIFSLRKSLPACDGGVLSLRDPNTAANGLTRGPALIASAQGALSLVKKWSQSFLARQVPGCGDGQVTEPEADHSFPDIPGSYYCRSDTEVCQASRFTLGLLCRTDPRAVLRRRRENYACLRRSIAGTPGIRFLWQEEMLSDGICPLGLPVLVDDRWRWWNSLNAAGISVSRWWEGYHRGLDWSEFPEARELKDRLLLLPVHQGLTTRYMEYAGDVIHSLAAGRAH